MQIGSHLSSSRNTLILFGLFALFVVAFGLLEHRAHSRVEFLSNFTGELQRLQSAALECQSGHRGYLLTGDDRFLDPYKSCKSLLPAQLAHTYRLSSG